MNLAQTSLNLSMLCVLLLINAAFVFSFNSKLPFLQFNKHSGSQVVEQYFYHWNKREIENAIDLFDENCVYEDSLFPIAFRGKYELKSHLINVANSLPNSFMFVLDSVSDDKNGNIGVQWHVESDSRQLPFTRGCSMYKVDLKTSKIYSGFDVPEPVIKSGSVSLALLRTATGFIKEPLKIIPLTAWVFYCWFLFISDIAPGPNALQLDPNTWKEVADLSFNFWLVLPILGPQFDVDTVSPVLEGIFNFLLAWAGLFIGFVVDGKESSIDPVKSNNKTDNSFVLPLVMMQLLTNAAFLPYLFTRTSKAGNDEVFSYDKLTNIEKFGESKVVPTFFGTVGIISIVWALCGRYDQGYVDIASRIASFTNIMQTDRLGFSFVVDLIYFSFFQGWLVDDDIKRRSEQRSGSKVLETAIAKYIPFFGLVYYLLTRPLLSPKVKY